MTASARRNRGTGVNEHKVEEETDSYSLPIAAESENDHTNSEIILCNEGDGGQNTGGACDDDTNAKLDADEKGQHHVGTSAAARARGRGAI